MTKKEVNEVLDYVAKEFISPLHGERRTGDEIWDEMSGVPFNKFVTFMHNMIKEEIMEAEKMYDPWVKNAYWLDRENHGFVNWEEEFYVCPRCDEPIYKCDWSKGKLTDFVCPLCELEGD